MAFYCEKCKREKKLPGIAPISYGPCESCGETAPCYDITPPKPKPEKISVEMKRAFEIVLELASDNALKEYPNCESTPEFQKLRDDQQEAIKLVRQHSKLIHHEKNCRCWACESLKNKSENQG